MLVASDSSGNEFSETGNLTIGPNYLTFAGKGFIYPVSGSPEKLIQAGVAYSVTGGAGVYAGATGVVTNNALLGPGTKIDAQVRGRLFLKASQ